MKKTLKLFAINNLLFAIVFASLFLSTSSTINFLGYIFVLLHLLAMTGLLTSRFYGWFLNLALTVNILIVSTFAIIRGAFEPESNIGETNPVGNFFTFGIVTVIIVFAWSLYRTNKSDYSEFFALTNQHRAIAASTGSVIAITLIIITL